MIVAVCRETFASAGNPENRVALVPTGVEKLKKLELDLMVETGAGEAAGFSDADFKEAGAEIVDHNTVFSRGEVVLQVRGVGANRRDGSVAHDLDLVRSGQILIGSHDPLWFAEDARAFAEKGATLLSLEMIPRISRAQSMDVLSSMATLAGYRAVLAGALELNKMFPMLMTAAGTLQAARVFVIGAGVAGLQAIATARRLGALVSGYDIRPAAAEQIASLGAKVVEVPVESADSEDAGGYAKAQGDDFNRRQREFLTEVVADMDLVITTAAIPGAPSPVLITGDMVNGMGAGSVIVDLAAERGGNCELTQADQLIHHEGVTILGPTDLPSRLPLHASEMHSNNVVSLMKHLVEDGNVVFDMNDEITKGTTTARDGEVLHPRVRSKLGLEPLQAPEPPPEPQPAQSEA